MSSYPACPNPEQSPFSPADRNPEQSSFLTDNQNPEQPSFSPADQSREQPSFLPGDLPGFRAILSDMIRQMTDIQLTDCISRNFMTQMIPHHRAAVQMSRTLLGLSRDKALRAAASQIMTEQTVCAASMEHILGCRFMANNSPRHLFHYQNRMNQIMENMFVRMSGAPFSGNVDAVFLCEMIPHHEGAIRMCQNVLSYKICPELTPLLHKIIESQQKGAWQLRQILKKSMGPHFMQTHGL